MTARGEQPASSMPAQASSRERTRFAGTTRAGGPSGEGTAWPSVVPVFAGIALRRAAPLAILTVRLDEVQIEQRVVGRASCCGGTVDAADRLRQRAHAILVRRAHGDEGG